MNETERKPERSSRWICARPHNTFVIPVLQAHQGEKRSHVCVQSSLASRDHASFLSSVHTHWCYIFSVENVLCVWHNCMNEPLHCFNTFHHYKFLLLLNDVLWRRASPKLHFQYWYNTNISALDISWYWKSIWFQHITYSLTIYSLFCSVACE